MDDFEKSFTQIKQLSTAVTEANYYDYCKQGYDILVRIHDSAVPQERVYNAFFEHQSTGRVIQRLVCRYVGLYMRVV